MRVLRVALTLLLGLLALALHVFCVLGLMVGGSSAGQLLGLMMAFLYLAATVGLPVESWWGPLVGFVTTAGWLAVALLKTGGVGDGVVFGVAASISVLFLVGVFVLRGQAPDSP